MSGQRCTSLRTGALGLAVLLTLAGVPQTVDAATLGFAELRRLARSSAAEPRLADARVDEARASSLRAWARILPQFTAEAGYVQRDREIAIALPKIPGSTFESPIFQYETQATVTLRADIAVLDPALWSSRTAANANVAAADNEAQAAADRSELAAIELALRLRAARAMWQAARDHAAALHAVADAAALRSNAGSASALDAERAAADALGADLDAERLGDSCGQLQRALGTLLQQDDAVDVADGETWTPPAAEATETALPALAAADARLQAAQAWRRAQRLEQLPVVLAGGSWQWSDRDALDGENTAWALQVGVRWNLFDRGLSRADVAEAEARAQQATLAREAVRRDLDRQRQDALAGREVAERSCRLAQERETVAGRVRDAAQTAFGLGALSAVDRVAAESTALRATQARLAAELDLALAGWRLAWTEGRL